MRFISSIVLFLSILTCNPVRTSYNPAIEFTDYETYCWMNNCTNPFTGPEYIDDSLLQHHVIKSIMLEMERKGFMYSNTNPDLAIDFHITIRDEEITTFHFNEDEPNYYRNTFMQPEKVILNKGSIVIHIVDLEKGELIWQSEASGYLDIPGDLTEIPIGKGVNKLLQEFPPKPER